MPLLRLVIGCLVFVLPISPSVRGGISEDPNFHFNYDRAGDDALDGRAIETDGGTFLGKSLATGS